jgi:hypothetical protein
LVRHLDGSDFLNACKQLAGEPPLQRSSGAARQLLKGKDHSAEPRKVHTVRDIVTLIPAHAPAPPTEHHQLGKPNQKWSYLDAIGGLMGHVLRFDTVDGEKEFRPLTLWRDGSGRLEWRWEGWPLPRPLYGLKELADRPSATVVVCEGEKSTDAARHLLPYFVVVTSSNGSPGAKQADWSTLRGRNVVIWPDADAPGRKYARAVTECLAAVGAGSMAVVSPPGGVKEGWDAADALKEGWTPDEAANLIDNAVPVDTDSDNQKDHEQQTTLESARASTFKIAPTPGNLSPRRIFFGNHDTLT